MNQKITQNEISNDENSIHVEFLCNLDARFIAQTKQLLGFYLNIISIDDSSYRLAYLSRQLFYIDYNFYNILLRDAKSQRHMVSHFNGRLNILYGPSSSNA